MFLFCALSGKAQFAQVDASWTYNDYNPVTWQNYPRGIFTIGDTVILGQVCHIIIGDCACGTSQVNYAYEINRRVYWYNNALNSFTLLYDFNLDAGGLWTVIAQNSASDSLRLRVDSTGTDTINGVLCKVQYIHTVSTYGNAYVFEGPVVEWIGSLFCLYPQAASCDQPTFRLRCYQDDFLGLYDTHFAPSCEDVFVDSGIGITEIENRLTAAISPNPFFDEAWITLTNHYPGNVKMELTDAAGRIFREQAAEVNKFKIEKNDLAAGIYFLHIHSKEKTVTEKIIIL